MACRAAVRLWGRCTDVGTIAGRCRTRLLLSRKQPLSTEGDPQHLVRESPAVSADDVAGSPTTATRGDPELEALGLVDERAEAFLKGRAAGARAASEDGPVPDAVVEAIASMIASDPSKRIPWGDVEP